MCKELFRAELACPLICKGCYQFSTLPAALDDSLFPTAVVQLVTLAVLTPGNITKNVVLVLAWVGVALGISVFQTKSTRGPSPVCSLWWGC